MPLNKETLKTSLKEGFSDVLKKQSSQTDENESPESAIDRVAGELAEVVAKCVERYIAGGEVIISNTNLSVVASSFGSPCAITVISPIKLQ